MKDIENNQIHNSEEQILLYFYVHFSGRKWL